MENTDSPKFTQNVNNENMVLFCSHDPRKPNWRLSNWAQSPFLMVENYIEIEFKNSEQYMMWSKAKLFGDKKTMREILSTGEPDVIKKLGREVYNFNETIWIAKRYDIVFQGCLAKFSQNEEFRDFLLATKDAILVEAAHYDKIWGVGLRDTDPDILDPKLWKGENLLGKILMQVRNRLVTPRDVVIEDIRYLVAMDIFTLEAIKNVQDTHVFDVCSDICDTEIFRSEDAVIADITFENEKFIVVHGYFGDNSNGILFSRGMKELLTEFGEGIVEVSEFCPNEYKSIAQNFVDWASGEDGQEPCSIFIIPKENTYQEDKDGYVVVTKSI